MERFLALPLCLVATGLSAQAAALTFRFQYEAPITNASGTYSVMASAAQIFNLPTSGGQTATALTYTFAPDPMGNFANGTGMVTSTTGSLNFTFTGASSSTGMNGTLLTLSGGMGAYVGYTGSGVVSHTINSVNPNLVDGQFFVNIQPTPEPTSAVAIGLAGVALVRRRSRRAAR